MTLTLLTFCHIQRKLDIGMCGGARGIITTNDYLFIALQVGPPCVGELAWSTLTVNITAPKCQNRGLGHRPNTGTASLYKHNSCLHTLFANSLFCFIIHSLLTIIYTGMMHRKRRKLTVNIVMRKYFTHQ